MSELMSDLRYEMKRIIPILCFLFNATAWSAEAQEETVKETAQQIVSAPEDKIPLTINAVKPAQVGENPLVKMVVSLGIFAVFAIGGFIFITRLRRKSKSGKASQIKVLTQHYLGPKKSLSIIRVAGESILIGITDQSITHIKTLSLLDEEIPDSTPREFSNLIKDEDFSMKGIKDIVSDKMKNMRSLQ